MPAGDVSPVNRVVFNDSRWVRGSTAYIGDLAAYRQYMVNHEVGHALGHQHAHQCLPGGLAPAMMQQTFGLRSAADNSMCQANPWPYPPGATGAPGAEQPDTPQNDEYNIGDYRPPRIRRRTARDIVEECRTKSPVQPEIQTNCEDVRVVAPARGAR